MTKKLLIISLLTTLSACSGDVKDTLGMRKTAPDEFVVISNPPLSVPPQFDLPDPNSEETIKSTPEQNKPVSTTPTALTKDELKFIDSLGAKSALTDTKKIIEKERLEQKKADSKKGVVSKTFSKISGSSSEPVINPVSERERITENNKEGKPLNEGKVKNKEESTLKRILN